MKLNFMLQVGLSISGLVRLCGIDRAAISKTTSEGVSKTTLKWLEPLMNKVLCWEMELKII